VTQASSIRRREAAPGQYGPGVNSEHDREVGRPRYQAGPGGQPGAGGSPLPSARGGQVVPKTARTAVGALAFAAVGWMLPVFGGVIAIRRGNAALREIAASGGELEGVPLAVWARRLGWCWVIVWCGIIFFYAGGPLIQLIYSFVIK
jgi:hypothetical protein